MALIRKTVSKLVGVQFLWYSGILLIVSFVQITLFQGQPFPQMSCMMLLLKTGKKEQKKMFLWKKRSRCCHGDIQHSRMPSGNVEEPLRVSWHMAFKEFQPGEKRVGVGLFVSARGMYSDVLRDITLQVPLLSSQSNQISETHSPSHITLACEELLTQWHECNYLCTACAVGGTEAFGMFGMRTLESLGPKGIAFLKAKFGTAFRVRRAANRALALKMGPYQVTVWPQNKHPLLPSRADGCDRN